MRQSALALLFLFSCSTATKKAPPPVNDGGGFDRGGAAQLPLVLVADIPLPGNSVRFDYEDIDLATNRLVLAHMDDDSVLVVDLHENSVLKELPGISIPRGVAFGTGAGRIFVTSSPNQLVIVDSTSLTEIGRAETGDSPDGVAWDPVDKIVGVSDQGDGAVSLITDAGSGTRTQIHLGSETGNVVYDAGRNCFWAAEVMPDPPDQLIAIDPIGKSVSTKIDLPGCEGAHGVRLHPDGKSAFVACEGNQRVFRVDLGASHSLSSASTGGQPDVLSIDASLGWLYVASENGDVTVVDIDQSGVSVLGHASPGENAHSVAADPRSHDVYFPLTSGPDGKPVLRIMKPSGI